MATTNIDKLKFKPKAPTDIVSCFIKKSYELLEDQRFPEIVDWNAEGTALVIKKPTEFSQKVLPTYFKHNNLTSFVRQLNMYDFHKRRTQQYDHVYYHDLFQKDKKHLLKEIKRKNQDNTLANIQKAIETLESVQNGQTKESATNIYENQLLKKLNKDAMGRIASLESKVKELTIQNQALWTQITHQNQKEDLLVSFLATFMKKKGITLDQLPSVLSNQFNLPHLNVSPSTNAETKDDGNVNLDNTYTEIYKRKPINVGDFLNFGEDSCNSTEMSPSSPLSKGVPESDKSFLEIAPSNLDNLPELKSKIQESIAINNPNLMNDAMIPEPIGNGKRDWNLENNFLSSFASIDNKANENEVLGKRQNLGQDTVGLIDKLVKKESFVMPQDFNPFSNGDNNNIKEDIDCMKLRKMESFSDLFTGIDHMSNPIDLMDFSRF